MDWIKLHRRSIESDVFADADLWRLWCWLLMRVAFKTTHLSVVAGGGRVIVTLAPGECITGRKAGAVELKWSPSTFERRLKKLEAMQMIEIQPQPNYSVVKVVNWQKYQVEQGGHQRNTSSNDDSGGDGEQGVNRVRAGCEQGVNRVRAGCEQGVNTNKKDKKDKKERSNTLSSSKLEAFESFWKTYPIRVTEGGQRTKGNKANAAKQWASLSEQDCLLAFKAVKIYAASRQRPKDCERWLREHRWNDWLDQQADSPIVTDPSQWSDGWTDGDDVPPKSKGLFA